MGKSYTFFVLFFGFSLIRKVPSIPCFESLFKSLQVTTRRVEVFACRNFFKVLTTLIGLFVSDLYIFSNTGNHSLFIQEGDLLKGMGHNDFGQLANGVMPSMVSPTAPKFGVREVSAGSHSIILMWDGTAWAWGANTLGQLADDTNVSKSIPQRVKLSDGSILKDIESVIATEYNSYYLTESGRVWASSNWSTTGRSELEQIINQDGTPFSGVVKLSAGLGQVVFLMGDGSVWAVGRNNNGQVGDGTTTDRTYPVQVINSDGNFFTGVKDISAAGYHTMYLKVNGEVWGAGFNHDGQLGNGTYDSSPFPVQMINEDGTPFNEVVALSGGTGRHPF